MLPLCFGHGRHEGADVNCSCCRSTIARWSVLFVSVCIADAYSYPGDLYDARTHTVVAPGMTLWKNERLNGSSLTSTDISYTTSRVSELETYNEKMRYLGFGVAFSIHIPIEIFTLEIGGSGKEYDITIYKHCLYVTASYVQQSAHARFQAGRVFRYQRRSQISLLSHFEDFT